MRKIFSERMFERNADMHNEIDRLSRKPANRRLRYVAYGFIGIALLLLTAMIIWHHELPYRTILFMRGCVGLCACIFFILVAILTYRLNSAYIRQRRPPRRR